MARTNYFAKYLLDAEVLKVVWLGWRWNNRRLLGGQGLYVYMQTTITTADGKFNGTQMASNRHIRQSHTLHMVRENC